MNYLLSKVFIKVNCLVSLGSHVVAVVDEKHKLRGLLMAHGLWYDYGIDLCCVKRLPLNHCDYDNS